MVILKKVKGGSLVETLTASVIIVVVFMIASFSLNNIFMNSIQSDDTLLKNRLDEIKYLFQYNKISFPFLEEGKYWIISGEENGEMGHFEIKNLRKGKSYKIEIPRD